jgi:hypothetical protein
MENGVTVEKPNIYADLQKIANLLDEIVENINFNSDYDTSFNLLIDLMDVFYNFEKEFLSGENINLTLEFKQDCAMIKDNLYVVMDTYSKKQFDIYRNMVSNNIRNVFLKIRRDIFKNFVPEVNESVSEINVKITNAEIKISNVMNDEVIDWKISYPQNNNKGTQHFVISIIRKTSIIFDIMPFKMPKFNIEIDSDILNNVNNDNSFVSLSKDIMLFYLQVIRKTNLFLTEHKELKLFAQNFDNVLFYVWDTEIDGGRLGSIYKRYQNVYNGKIYKKVYPCGWNNDLRIWEDSGYRFSMEELLKCIIDNKIKKIVGINAFLIDEAMNYDSILLPVVLDYLGVEFVSVDVDPVEMYSGQYRRVITQREDFTRFTVLPVLAREWDEMYNIKGINYTPIVQHYEFKSKKTMQIKDEYSVLVLSQSRINDVCRVLNLILFLMDNFQSDCIYTEFQICFLAIRKMVLNARYINEYELNILGEYVHKLFYTMSQFLKYEVIDNIDTDRKVLIYGDKGWGKVFPQYFQNKYISSEEIEEIDLKNSHLHLLFHMNFNYLEAGGPVYDAIAKNRVFINFPAIVRLPQYEGFSVLEYRNKEDINRLINNVNTYFDNEKLKVSIEHYNNVMIDSEKNITENIFENTSFPEGGSIYWKECKESYMPMYKKVDEYINSRPDFLNEIFDICLGKKSVNMDIKKSKYFEKSYIRALYEHYIS